MHSKVTTYRRKLPNSCFEKKWRRALKLQKELGLGVKELTFPEFYYITYKEGWKIEIVLKERNEA